MYAFVQTEGKQGERQGHVRETGEGAACVAKMWRTRPLLGSFTAITVPRLCCMVGCSSALLLLLGRMKPFEDWLEHE